MLQINVYCCKTITQRIFRSAPCAKSRAGRARGGTSRCSRRWRDGRRRAAARTPRARTL